MTSSPSHASVAPRGDAVSACFHCGDPVPPGLDLAVRVDGREEPMCCHGCAAAAAAVVDFGLAGYYRQREAPSPRPEDGADAALTVYDDPALQARFVTHPGAHAEARLAVEGMSCAACAWLLEQRLGALKGVQDFEVDFARRRARLDWDPARIALSAVLAAAAEIGFRVRPFTPEAARELAAAESRAMTRRTAVALLFGAQVMMIAVALYLAGTGGMDAGLRTFLRHVSLVLSLPVIGYCAWPIHVSAASALRAGSVNMDVPVSLALLLAFGGSVAHVLAGAGEIYFDSVVMFTALLLVARTLELRARVTAAGPLDALAALVPDSARVRGPGGEHAWETVPVLRLRPGAVVHVLAGETLPADGMVQAGTGTVDEAILTGESRPRPVAVGEAVIAGSVCVDGPLAVEVTRVGEDAFAGQLARLVGRAAAARPASAALGLRVARWFVLAVLLAAAAAATVWSQLDPSRAFAVTLSVLVVSCPCALALAVPAALSAAYGALLARGVAVVNGSALERTAAAGCVMFDKTGTLTHGRLAVARVTPFGGTSAAGVLAYARSLAAGSNHPVARALVAAGDTPPAPAGDVTELTGQGLRGQVDGARVVLGSRALMHEECAGVPDDAGLDAAKDAWLAVNGRVAGRIAFDDTLRAEAPALFAWLRRAGLATAVLSGDRPAAVARVADACGADTWSAGLLPADKLNELARRQAAGETVAMIGDGLNDAPVLARADVSVAVADAVALSRQRSDVLLLEADLGGIRALFTVARATRRIVRQNFAWALGYNLVALPLAFGGWLPPWGAALGMSASSLAVVANALRLRHAARG